MTMKDALHRDYDHLAADLTDRFGTKFTIDAIGVATDPDASVYALTANIENGFLLITNGNGSDQLEVRQQMEGWAIAVHVGGEQKVHLRKPEPRGLMLLDECSKEMGDTVAQALRAATFKPGTKVQHRRWPEQAGPGVITEFPAIDPDGFHNIDHAIVTWADGEWEIEDLYDLI